MTPKLSIIVPVYNTEIYLKECLDSLVNQTFKDIEIIIVNDCSPDNSEAVVLEYQQKDPRIKYIKHDKNLGLGGARNTGITNASGEWIAFVDSDDYIDLNTYKTMLSLMDKHKANLGVFSVIKFDDITKEETYDPFFNCDINILTALNYQNFYKIRNVIACNKIFKRSDLISHNITFPEHLKHEDEEFWFKYVVAVEPSVIGSNKKFYHYRQRSNSIMGQRDLSYKDIPQICLNIYLFLQQNNKEVLYRQFLLSSLVQYFHYYYEELSPVYKVTFQEQTLQLFQNIEITKEELEQYPLLNLFYIDNPISQQIVYKYIHTIERLTSDNVIYKNELSQYLQNYQDPISDNKWYNFGQLSKKQKIKKIVVVISKKLKLYPILKNIYKIVRK